jgi:hypothetical protein
MQTPIISLRRPSGLSRSVGPLTDYPMAAFFPNAAASVLILDASLDADGLPNNRGAPRRVAALPNVAGRPWGPVFTDSSRWKPRGSVTRLEPPLRLFIEFDWNIGAMVEREKLPPSRAELDRQLSMPPRKLSFPLPLPDKVWGVADVIFRLSSCQPFIFSWPYPLGCFAPPPRPPRGPRCTGRFSTISMDGHEVFGPCTAAGSSVSPSRKLMP